MKVRSSGLGRLGCRLSHLLSGSVLSGGRLSESSAAGEDGGVGSGRMLMECSQCRLVRSSAPCCHPHDHVYIVRLQFLFFKRL